MMKLFQGLFIKIQSIALIGILGVGVLAGVNAVVNGKVDSTARQSQLGNNMANHILNALRLEETFVQSGDETIVSDIWKTIKSFNASIQKIREYDIAPDIGARLAEIEGICKKHRDALKIIIPEALGVKKTAQELDNTLIQAQAGLEMINKKLGEEEVELSLTVDELPPEKAALRDQVNQLIAILQSCRANIQALLLNNEGEGFLEARKQIEKVLSEQRVIVNAQVQVVNDPVYSDPWKPAATLMDNLSPLQDQLFGHWKLRQEWTQKSKVFCRKLQSKSSELAKDIISIASSQRKASGRISLIASGFVILGLLLLGTFIANGIRRSISHTVGMLKDIAEGEGDLTRRLDSRSRDELGEMAGWFNTFIERLQVLIREVSDNASNLHTTSNGLTTISNQLRTGAGEMSEKSQAVADASKEMSANMMSVAAASEQASTNTNMVAAATEEMTVTVQEISKNAEEARDVSTSAIAQAANASEKVNLLGDATRQISRVTEVITEISEQTNLLALNATIEAARAGEAGKGFAVVAGEIKELARQTASATQEIKEKINDITRSTSETVVEIRQISEVFDKVNTIINRMATVIEEQSVSSREIASNIAQASQGIEEVNQNVNESSEFSSTISTDISQVNNVVLDVNNASDQVNDQSEELTQLASRLIELVGRFKV